MKKTVLCLALVYLSTYKIISANAYQPCGDDTWTTYTNEKCFKLFKSFEVRERADEICNEENSTLVTIKSAAEQTFLIEYVFNSSYSNNVWIGASRRLDSSTEFDWNDGSPVELFTNWAVGRPSDVVSRTCVLMQSIFARNLYQMEWTDAACNNGYWFICEKIQVWSLEQLQQAFLKNRRELQHLSQNPGSCVPIGFIYVQLPDQPEPQNLWGTVGWTDITPQYAGLFFRAEGGGSEAFGIIQEENSPRLLSVGHTQIPNPVVPWIAIDANNAYSETITSGATPSPGLHSGLNFRVSSGQVRPRNQAMRIWRRNQ